MARARLPERKEATPTLLIATCSRDLSPRALLAAAGAEAVVLGIAALHKGEDAVCPWDSG
jgi:hypothetical protein